MHLIEADQGPGRAKRHRGWAVAAVIAGGLVAAACSSGSTAASSSSTTAAPPSGSASTTGPAAGSGSGFGSILSGIKRSADATFSATYQTADSTTGKSQTVTFAQSPPKTAVVTPTGAFYLNGSSVTACQGSGAGTTCSSLPTSLGKSLTGITDLFSPGVLTTTLKTITAQAALHVAGIHVQTSSATYGGLASSCATLTSPSQPKPVTYCVADSSGILTYSSANGTTVTLTSFTASPPAAVFTPPEGVTVQTLPSGA